MSSGLPREVSDALTAGWTVITANQRAARTLRRGYDREQQAAGRTGWASAQVFGWETWTAMLWRRLVVEGQDTRLLLSGVQEHAVWVEAIGADAGGTSLRTTDSLAELAARAWRLLHSWECREELAGRADTSDTRAFARWAGTFDRLCARGGYLTGAELPGALGEAARAGRLRLSGEGLRGLLLVGFDRRTLAEEGLLRELAAAGVPIRDATYAGGRAETPARLVHARSEREERRTCAGWIREFLEANPGARVAVIVPSPGAARAELERTLRHVLAPELEDLTWERGGERGAMPVEFSLGVPLAGTPIASTGLEILEWSAEALGTGRISSLLLSPYFAGGGEYLERAEFDAFVVREELLLEPQLTVDGVAGLLAGSRWAGQCPELLRHLRRLHAESGRVARSGQQSYAGWSESFGGLLAAAGWAERLDSVEFQTQRRWEAALDELASLDFTGGRVSFSTALNALRRIAAGMLFAPESEDAPVQVMGPMEAAGSEFDAVWFLEAGDASWPVRTTPNPLVPWGMAREYGMPGVDAEREMELARRVTRRIRESARVVVLSYAGETESGHQRPSAALAGLDLSAVGAGDVVQEPAAVAPVLVERIADESVVAAPPQEGFRGGAEVLKAQAACGFKAFAERRLSASGLETREPGLNAMERGLLIHAALEGFWRAVKSQAALLRLGPGGRADALQIAADEALAEFARKAEGGWGRAYLAMERERLLRLLGRWVEFETTRSPFLVVALEEPLREVQIGPLRLTVRVDRVDLHLVGGEPAGHVLVDYKTSTVKPGDWLSDRPDEPQLPLYAVVAGGDLAGVAFATLRAGDEMKMAGYEARKGVLAKAANLKTPTLAQQVEAWREVLEELARQFHAGEARVAPKKYPTTCRTCEQRLLCRLDPAKLEPAALEELDELATEWEGQFA